MDAAWRETAGAPHVPCAMTASCLGCGLLLALAAMGCNKRIPPDYGAVESLLKSADAYEVSETGNLVSAFYDASRSSPTELLSTTFDRYDAAFRAAGGKLAWYDGCERCAPDRKFLQAHYDVGGKKLRVSVSQDADGKRVGVHVNR